MSEEKESRIGQSMVITGDVECTKPLLLEGKIDGSFVGTKLIIKETGQLLGQATGESIECSGRIEGNVITGSLRLLQTACHVGTAEAGELVVEPGAILDCALQSGTEKGLKTAPAANVVEKPTVKSEAVKSELVIAELLSAFQEGTRPCCIDVPWSERLELYSHLLELLEKNKPLIKITGAAGSGKSVLAEKLRKSLPDTFVTLQVTDQVGSVSSLLQSVAADLEIKGATNISSPQELRSLIKPVLDEKRKNGQRVVLLVDDAEKMYPATMEGITWSLTNAYSDGDNLLQMILLGTEDMESKMVAPTLEYFEDETNCQLRLDPLHIKDTADYLRFCLQLASGGEGVGAVSLLPNETIKAIHVKSRGNIAEINNLANTALQSAHAAGATVVAPHFV